MKKPIYKLLDAKGRVLIPEELRKAMELERGDIVKLSIGSGKIMVTKVDIIEVGRQDKEAVESYVHAAIKTMNQEKQMALAAKLLTLVQQKEEADC